MPIPSVGGKVKT